MAQLILNRGTVYRKSYLRRLLPNIELGPYFLIVSLILFVVLMTVITLMFSTRQVTKGYVLNSLDSKYQDLVKVTEVRDMEISQVRSLNYIKNSSKVRSMVRPTNVVFIDSDTAIAQR